MSLSNLLSIARSALLTQQRAIDTTGHNIANAGTEGYSRQRLRLAPAEPLVTPLGQLGRGVTAEGIERIRDQYLDATYRREKGDRSRHATTRDLLGEIEGIFGEPGDTGIAGSLDRLWDSFSDLANDPTGQTPRELVRQAGADLARRFQDADRRIGEVRASVAERMQARVAEVNEITRQIAELNGRIRSVSAGLREAPDVEDERDRLVDRLSSLTGVRVLPRPDGTIGVVAGDALLVDAGQQTTLEVRALGNGRYGIAVAGSPGLLDPEGGELGALVELSTTTLPALRSELDLVASGIVREVNALHRAGRNLTGATGIDFFDPTGLTAAGMALSRAVSRSTDDIAAGQSGGAGDNATALAIAELRTSGVASWGGQTLASSYQRLVARLGVLVRDADTKATGQEAVVDHVDRLRESVSGVSVDEELTHLIAQQNAFAAAARLVTVADEMMQSVIGMVS